VLRGAVAVPPARQPPPARPAAPLLPGPETEAGARWGWPTRAVGVLRRAVPAVRAASEPWPGRFEARPALRDAGAAPAGSGRWPEASPARGREAPDQGVFARWPEASPAQGREAPDQGVFARWRAARQDAAAAPAGSGRWREARQDAAAAPAGSGRWPEALHVALHPEGFAPARVREAPDRGVFVRWLAACRGAAVVAERAAPWRDPGREVRWRLADVLPERRARLERGAGQAAACLSHPPGARRLGQDEFRLSWARRGWFARSRRQKAWRCKAEGNYVSFGFLALWSYRNPVERNRVRLIEPRSVSPMISRPARLDAPPNPTANDHNTPKLRRKSLAPVSW
jgi:hypothetical protein